MLSRVSGRERRYKTAWQQTAQKAATGVSISSVC